MGIPSAKDCMPPNNASLQQGELHAPSMSHSHAGPPSNGPSAPSLAGSLTSSSSSAPSSSSSSAPSSSSSSSAPSSSSSAAPSSSSSSLHRMNSSPHLHPSPQHHHHLHSQHQQQQQLQPGPPANHSNNMPPTKGSMTMDSQYMQQQSQIFVFSTQLANQAAEAVNSGHFQTIIEYHCTQPGTIKFLEKNPLKVAQFSRQHHAVWLNNLAQMKQGAKAMEPNQSMNNFPSGNVSSLLNQYPPFQGKASIGGPCMGPCNAHGPGGCSPGTGPGPGPGPGPGSGPGPGNWPMGSERGPNNSPWPQNNFAQPGVGMGPNPRFPNNGGHRGPGNSAMTSPFGGQNSYSNPNSNNSMSTSFPPTSGCNSVQSNQPPMPAGTKIPDENLTPRQRQHREEQLARLRTMQQTLLPELHNSDQHHHLHHQQQQHPGNCSMPGGQGPMMRMSAPPPGSNQQGGGGGDMCSQGIMDPSLCVPHSCLMSDHEPHGSDSSLSNIMNPSSMMGVPCSQGHGQGQGPPGSSGGPQGVGPQREWMKVQQQFYEDRRKPQSTSNSPNPMVPPSPGSRIAPPPPYHQGPRPLSSPHPASPATNSMPLPSPRMQSPADASRQQLNSGSHRLPPYPSPGPPTPSDNSLSMNPTLNSPKHCPPSVPCTTSGQGTVTNGPGIPRTVSSGCGVTPSNITSMTSNATSAHKKGPQESSLSSDMLSANADGSKGSIHSLPNCASPAVCKNEPQLMPVPSPQQIQYLNAFDGQELTIQKQPNTSLRESDLISPPDLDLSFGNDFSSSPFGSHINLENGPRFVNPLDGMNHRFGGPVMGENGPQYEMQNNQRFMSPENNVQRFGNPSFENGNRMTAPHENGMGPMRGPAINCPSYGAPSPMDGNGNLMRFPNHQEPPFGGNRMRGPAPGEMSMPRFPPGHVHMNENMQPPFGSQMMHSMGPMGDQQNFCSPAQQPPAGCINPSNASGEGVSSTHLQSLQKMTPPFDIGPPGKMDNMGNSGQLMAHPGPPPGMHGPGPGPGPGPVSNALQPQMGQNQRMNQFDPIASMAAMSETSPGNPMNPMVSGATMNMSSMQVAANGNGSQSGSIVNFHTSMHNVHQNMSPCPGPGPGPGNSGGNPNGMHNQHGQYGMQGQQMGHNMVGGPQTVNNTYVNATMSIQQLNIQNMPPNYNPNQMGNNGPGNGMGMQMPPNQMPNQMNQPPGNMQMMQHHQSMSPKLGPNGPVGGNMGNMGPRMGSPSNGPPGTCPFPGPGIQRPMNSGYSGVGGNMPGGPGRGPSGPSYNAPNIQVKPNAPNTIQYLPTRAAGPGPPQANKPPNLDFLTRYTTSLANLDNKVPTHNLQYFPSPGGNMNPNMPPGQGQGGVGGQPPLPNSSMPMAVGPGRPSMGGVPMMRGPGPNSMMGPGPGHGNPMMHPDMFNRLSNPGMGSGPPHNVMGVGPGGGGGPNPMFPGMKPGNGGPGTMSPVGMPPDASQPLPPSVGHSYGNHGNYKQPPFYGPMSSDPNYAVQFHNFQQQLYATNPRGGSNGPGPGPGPGPGQGNSCGNNQQMHPNNPMAATNFYGVPK